jgi:hypothetical protein
MRFIELITGDLVAPTDIRLWNGENKHYWLQFKDVNGLTVEGWGSLDGQGASWWTCKVKALTLAVQEMIVLVFWKALPILPLKRLLADRSWNQVK